LSELTSFMRPLLFAGSLEIDDARVNDNWGEEIELYGYACLNTLHVPASIRIVATQQMRLSRLPEARRKA
jgi:hypothetical protein